MSKIVSFGDSASRDTARENVQDMQTAFDALFINVCNASSELSIEQSIEVTRHIMGKNSAEVVAAVAAAPPSTAANKALKRFIHSARIALQMK
jgi:hypothetical protein